jgi:hypothetical protein
MEPRRSAQRVYTLLSKEPIMSKSLNLLVLAVVLAVSAGAADTPQTPRGIAPPNRIPDIETLTPLPKGEPVATAQIPREVRRAVVANAAKRFNVAENAVVLTNAEQLTWSDGSLGCPEPGRMYTQMLVAGFRVVAKTSAGELTYHTDSRGNAVTCGVRARPSDTGDDPSAPRTLPPPRAQPDR